MLGDRALNTYYQGCAWAAAAAGVQTRAETGSCHRRSTNQDSSFVSAWSTVRAVCIQAEAAAEAKLKGPHAFPLERALATFWELRNALDEEPGEHG